MSKADKMFQECGFAKLEVVNRFTGEEIDFCTEYGKYDGSFEEHIMFNNSTKLMTTSCELFGKSTVCMSFTPKLLTAIHEKCKELGWSE